MKYFSPMTLCADSAPNVLSAPPDVCSVAPPRPPGLPDSPFSFRKVKFHSPTPPIGSSVSMVIEFMRFALLKPPTVNVYMPISPSCPRRSGSKLPHLPSLAHACFLEPAAFFTNLSFLTQCLCPLFSPSAPDPLDSPRLSLRSAVGTSCEELPPFFRLFSPGRLCVFPSANRIPTIAASAQVPFNDPSFPYPPLLHMAFTSLEGFVQLPFFLPNKVTPLLPSLFFPLNSRMYSPPASPQVNGRNSRGGPPWVPKEHATLQTGLPTRTAVFLFFSS